MIELAIFPFPTAIALLSISIVGGLLGLWIAILLFRLSSLRRLSGVLTAPILDAPLGDPGQYAFAGVESSARNLLRLVQAECDCRFAALYLPRPSDDRLTIAAAEGETAAFLGSELSSFHPLVRRLASDGEPVEIEEADDDLPLPAHSLLLPVRSRGRLIGVLALGPRASGRPISERVRSLIALAAGQAAAPLENAQLYGSLRRAFSELENAQREILALQRVSVAAQSTLRLDEVLTQIALGVVEGLAFDTATVYLVDAETRTLSMPVRRGGMVPQQTQDEPVPFDEGNPSMRALLRGEVFVTHDLRESALPRLIEAGALSARELHSDVTIVNLPLAAKNRVIGGMALTTNRMSVSERQIESLRTFGAQAAATIENARLYGQIEQAYADLRTAQEQLIRAERLRTLGQVAGGVAHDFNNILAAILTRTQLAQQQTRSPTLRETLRVIERAALDGAGVTQRIQSLAKPRAERPPEVIEVNTILQQALEFTQPMWMNAARAQGVSLTAETDFVSQAPIEGQPSELREVFTNLILNAAAAMPSGGKLSLKTSDEQGWVWCVVEDTGAGMTDEVKRQLFDPFFTTKGAAGSGLGMSIVAAILERHGGKIEVDSAPGAGTSIRVGFPIATTRAATPRQRRRRGQVSLRLLIAEEDERTREALSLILSRHGHRVQTAAEADSALSLLVRSEFDVVITDLGLGERTGWEIAETCRILRPDAAVVLLTAWPGDWSAEDASRRGVDAILAKPFTVDEVLSCLERALVGSV
jgi:signal transduction histidine kinase